MQAFTQRLAAFSAIFTLFAFLSSISLSQASLKPTIPETLFKLGTLPPESADGPYQYWEKRNKYFLVVAVNETGLPDTQLPFTLVDAKEIAEALTALGYQPLDPDHPILSGKQATRSTIIHTLTRSHRKKEKDHLLIYFTGHGIVGKKDLWLQTYGQVAIESRQGLSLEDLVLAPRYKGEELGFTGNLTIILDTCYSGKGMLSHSLTLGELGRNTTIFSSSTKKQESYPLKGLGLPKMSAFTYSLLQAMGPKWPQADWDGDGILRYAEMHIFSKNLLKQLHEAGNVKALMEPEMLNADQTQFLAYDRKQVRTWTTPYRTALQTKEVSLALAKHLQTIGANPKAKPELPEEAQALAKGLKPAPEDYYGQFLQATTENRPEDARVLFAKAEEQSQKKEQEAEEAKQVERNKRYDLYLDRARMETYDGKFTAAFTYYQQATKMNTPRSLDLINEIGIAGLRAGKYLDAEPYLQQALEQREQKLDPNHPDIGISLNNLAVLYKTQGKYAEAEPLYQRSFWIFLNRLGAEHPYVQRNFGNYQEFLKTSGQPHSMEDVLSKLQQARTSIATQSSSTTSDSTP